MPTQIEEILEALSDLSCEDNSCHFASKPRRGMGTNGGCRCLKHVPVKLKLALMRIWQSKEAE